jgi:hypothetical protein
LVGWKDVATRAVLVCRRWREVGRDDALWHFFFRSYYRTTPPTRRFRSL